MLTYICFNMQDTLCQNAHVYVNMRLIHVNMQHDYVDMQHNPG